MLVDKSAKKVGIYSLSFDILKAFLVEKIILLASELLSKACSLRDDFMYNSTEIQQEFEEQYDSKLKKGKLIG